MNDNFFCISNYSHPILGDTLDWVENFPNHIIYDKTWNGGFLNNQTDERFGSSNLKERYPKYNIINSSLNGYNIFDFFSYIIDYYDNLPDIVVFCKNDTFPRRIRESKFYKLVQNKCFTPIEDWKLHENNSALTKGPNLPYAMLSCDGGWMEINDSWYLRHHEFSTKYFTSYNDFLNFCFIDPVLPLYTRFAPGASYVVPKNYILKYDKIFYQNLRTFISYSRLPGEAHMIERALYTI